MNVVALHGAFRGGWYWEPLAAELATRGHRLVGPDLDGASLSEWIGVARRGVEGFGGEPVVVVGHSMGGVVAQALPSEVAPLVERLVLLDAPLIDPGHRAVDVSAPPGAAPVEFPPRDHLVAPAPVGPDQGFSEPGLTGWVNERLRGVPMGPQLDPVPDGLGRPSSTRIVFFGLTPAGYPAALARQRCEREGIRHDVVDGLHHDAPVLAPARVAELVAEPGGALSPGAVGPT